MKYIVKPTSRFRRDYKLMEKRSLDMSLLDELIVKLAEGIPLPASNRDHPLTGRWSGHRECHIEPDWLLIYRIEATTKRIVFYRSGSHSDLF